MLLFFSIPRPSVCMSVRPAHLRIASMFNGSMFNVVHTLLNITRSVIRCATKSRYSENFDEFDVEEQLRLMRSNDCTSSDDLHKPVFDKQKLVLLTIDNFIQKYLNCWQISLYLLF